MNFIFSIEDSWITIIVRHTTDGAIPSVVNAKRAKKWPACRAYTVPSFNCLLARAHGCLTSYTTLSHVLFIFAKYLYLHKWVRIAIKTAKIKLMPQTHLCSYLLKPKTVGNRFQSQWTSFHCVIDQVIIFLFFPKPTSPKQMQPGLKSFSFYKSTLKF